MAKGFTKTDNGFLETLYSGEADLSCCDMRILLYVLRYTVGYQKKTLSISAKEIARATNMTQRQAEKTLAKLCGCGFLKLTSTKGKANTYEIDKAEFTSASSSEQKFGGIPNYSSEEYRTEIRGCSEPEFGGDTNYSSEDTIIKKNKRNVCKESGTHTPVFFSQLWEEYPQKVGKGKLTDEDYAALDRYSYSELHRAIERYKRDKEAKGIDYWQNGSTFFKTGYIDYLDENYTGEERTRERTLDPHGKEYEG